MAVARLEFTLETPTFARIEVAAAKRDDPRASTNHIRLSPLYYPFLILSLLQIEKCAPSGELGIAAQFFFDPEKLVVFCHPVTSAGSAGFDLSRVHGNGDVCNGGIFRFTGAMGYDGGIACPVCHGNGIQSLREGTNLVDLDQNGIGNTFFDSLRQALRSPIVFS